MRRGHLAVGPSVARLPIAAAGLLLALASFSVSPAMALQLRQVQVEGIGLVLLAQDCPPVANQSCDSHERRVYQGDAERIDRALRAARFDEVWLNSVGGDSAEGPRIGAVLRRHGMSVRIRSGHVCASACTVAFLGGILRTVDEGGEYLVHARSGFSELSDEQVARVMSNPAGEIERHVLQQRQHNRRFVAERLIYLQTMLNGRPDGEAYRRVMEMGLNLPPAYLSSAAFSRDVARVRVEHSAAVHSLLLDLERQSFDEALEHARQHLSSLGSRAEAAHRMMEAMFATSIVRTSLLSPETLLRLGFITQAVGK